MDEIKLSNGNIVRVEVTPFMIGIDLANKIPELRAPDEPMVEVKIMKGKSTEIIPAPKDSKEWKEYVAQTKEIDELRGAFTTFLPWQEGVKEWKLAGSEEWVSEPPEDFQMPRLLESVGGFAPHLDNRRIAYVRYVVCKSTRDVLNLTSVLQGGNPISEQEVSDAMEGFPGETPRSEDQAAAE